MDIIIIMIERKIAPSYGAYQAQRENRGHTKLYAKVQVERECRNAKAWPAKAKRGLNNVIRGTCART